MNKNLLAGGSLLIIVLFSVSYFAFFEGSPLRQIFSDLVSPSSQTAAAIDEGIIYQREAASTYTANGPGTDIGDIGGGLAAITVSAWVEPSATNGVYHLVSKYSATDASWALWYSSVSGAYLFTALSANGSYGQPFHIPASPSGKHHVVGTYDGIKARLYFDGALVGTPQDMSGSIKNTGIPVCIGSQGGAGCATGSYFPGTIEKVRIYNKALTATDVASLFTDQGGTNVPPVIIPPVIVVDPPVVIPPTDPAGPTVSITAPSSGTTISSSPTAITANATAASGKTITRVQFKVNGSNVGSEDTSSPYTASWTSTGLVAGTYSVTAEARDSGGLTTISSPISLIISAGPVVQPALRRTVSWTAPVGVPEPPFGIREDVTHRLMQAGETCQYNPDKCYDFGSGPVPYNNRLNADGEPYTHYVDNSTYPNCDISDDGSNEGTPARPLCRIPLQIPAGAIVEVHGVFGGNWHHLSPGHITINGTSERPVYIRGMSSNKPRITTGWEVTGRYGIIENLIFKDADGNRSGGSAGYLGIFAGVYGPTKFRAQYLSFRHNEMDGNLDTQGLNVTLLPVPSAANPSISEDNNVVVYNNHIHHTGDLYSEVDKDVGNIKVAGKRIWVVDNLAHDNGNGMFTGGGNGDSVAPLNDIQYIFFGRNTAYANREANFFTKQASHVVFSENTSGVSYDLRGPGQIWRGGGMGYQYGPRNVWFINNKLSEGSAGFLIGSDGVETTQNAYFIGNVITNIHKNTGQATPQGALNIGGGLNHYIVNNTIDDVDLGIYAGTNGHKYISGNIVTNANVAGGAFFGNIILNNEHGGLVPHLINNLVYQTTGVPKVSFPTINNTGDANTICGVVVGCTSGGNLNANPLYTNPGSANYSLQSNSPAKDKGDTALLQQLANTYQANFGVPFNQTLSISKDVARNPRVAGAGADMGAYESAGGVVIPPTNVYTVTKSGTGQGTIYGGTLACGINQTICTDAVTTGPINLTAVRANGSVFVRWEGACSGKICTLSKPASTTANAVFNTVSTANGPVISNISITHLIPTGAYIIWTTSVPATGEIKYGLTTSYGNTTLVQGSFLTSRGMSMNRLTPNTTYHYKIVAQGEDGGITETPDRTFTTPAANVVDTVLPTVSLTHPAIDARLPDGLTTLQAAASDNVGVTEVRFYINNVLQGSPDTTSPYTTSWSATQGAYSIAVSARDLAGNRATSTRTVYVIARPPSLVPIETPKTVAPIPTPVPTTPVVKDTPITSLQKVLKSQGYITEVTGVLDAKTVSALKVFQWRNNLAVPGGATYGTLDAKTQAKVTALLATIAPVTTNTTPAVSTVAPATTPSVVPTKTLTTGASITTVTQNLAYGSRGNDVKILQQFLNANGFTISSSGVGSPGNETDFFGYGTQDALIKFQTYYKISPPGGFFGPLTREKMKSLVQ
ncbi:MAG: Ig-like domain-containing protein [Patescibacteria group bacterium]